MSTDHLFNKFTEIDLEDIQRALVSIASKSPSACRYVADRLDEITNCHRYFKLIDDLKHVVKNEDKAPRTYREFEEFCKAYRLDYTHIHEARWRYTQSILGEELVETREELEGSA